MAQLQTQTRTANNIIQTTGGSYATFNDLQNLKLDDSHYAQTVQIKSKTDSPNRPSTIMFTDFRFNLPTGSRVKQIAVIYQQMKVSAGGGGVCNIPAPKLTLQNAHHSPAEQNGHAPTTEFSTFTRNWVQGVDMNQEIVENKNFGVQINYPANTNTYTGFVRIYRVQIRVSYYVPEFGLGLNRIKGEYNGDEYEIQATITNKSGTSFRPLCTINIPLGFGLSSYNLGSSDAKLTRESATVYTWYPYVKGVSTDTLTLRFTTNVTYTGTSTVYNAFFDMSEYLNSTYTSLTVPVKKVSEAQEQATEDTVIDDGTSTTTTSKRLKLRIDQTYTEMFKDEVQDFSCTVYDSSENDVTENFTIVEGTDYWSITPDTYVDYNCTAEITIDYTTATDVSKTIYLHIVNPTISNEVVILTPTDEEVARLGDGHTYIASTTMKTLGTEDYIRDWDTTFRIGVFNNAIDSNVTVVNYTDSNGETQEMVLDTTDYSNLSLSDMLPYIVWSNPLSLPKTYETLTCEFRYNKDYPLHVIVAGDDMVTNGTAIQFTTPEIEETTEYNGRETSGLYPVPIKALPDNTLNSEIVIPANTNATPVILYKIPYTQIDNHIVQGIQINGYLDYSDQTTVTARVKTPNGESRVKSTTINLNDTVFSIGGYGDLWGFNTESISTDVEDWEIHLTLGNNTDTQRTLNIRSLEVVLYIQEIDDSKIKIYIDGEDLSYYGIFLREVKIPEGLETDVDYLTINGTDTNNALLQSIREKTLELELDIGDSCDLTENTNLLRRLTKLFTNKRTKYNKPIPKRIQFSHYPDVYWEYILTKAFTNTINISEYEVKIKLEVPSGTSRAINPTTTTDNGYVDGLVPAKPVILIRPTDEVMNITETITGQTFNLGYTNYSGKLIEIDCNSRNVWLKENELDTNPIEISQYTDLNNDWFRLIETYNFETKGCNILQVTYTEQW